MKIKNYILLCFFFLFFSCGAEDDEGEYFKFTQEDYTYIPTVYKEEGKIRNYINQHNDTIKIRNGSYSLEKKFAGGIINAPIPSYHYDELRISLDLLSVKPVNYIQVEIWKRTVDTLGYTVKTPGYNPNVRASFVFYAPESMQHFTQLTTAIKTYNDVLELKASDRFFGNDSYFTLADNATFHTIYYSLKHGIIGFDDTKNNLNYRLKD